SELSRDGALADGTWSAHLDGRCRAATGCGVLRDGRHPDSRGGGCCRSGGIRRSRAAPARAVGARGSEPGRRGLLRGPDGLALVLAWKAPRPPRERRDPEERRTL